MPPRNRPGASRRSGSKRSFSARIRSSDGGGGPHGSTAGRTAAGASQTTSDPPAATRGAPGVAEAGRDPGGRGRVAGDEGDPERGVEDGRGRGELAEDRGDPGAGHLRKAGRRRRELHAERTALADRVVARPEGGGAGSPQRSAGSPPFRASVEHPRHLVGDAGLETLETHAQVEPVGGEHRHRRGRARAAPRARPRRATGPARRPGRGAGRWPRSRGAGGAGTSPRSGAPASRATPP